MTPLGAGHARREDLDVLKRAQTAHPVVAPIAQQAGLLRGRADLLVERDRRGHRHTVAKMTVPVCTRERMSASGKSSSPMWR
ncbi:hypothetical protein ACVWZW_005028 [Bradyrhizobium sp. F1.13.4]